MKQITEREKDVLRYIIRFKEVNGYSPTTREIASGINTSSLYHVTNMLFDLKEKGYITFKEKAPRTIRVIKFL